MLDSPSSRMISIGAEPAIELIANHRAWYTLETVTNKPYREALQEYCQGTEVSRFYPLLWSLMSSWRYRNKKNYLMTKEEREDGYTVPGAFLEAMPMGDGWEGIKMVVYDLLVDSGHIVEKAKDEDGNIIERPKDEDDEDFMTPVSV